MAISEQQQQINMEKFKMAQERARKLISNDAKAEISEGKKPKFIPGLEQSMSGNLSRPQINEYDEYEEAEPQYLSESQMQELHEKAKKMPIQQTSVRNTKLPDAILKAFKENPIDTSILESQMGMESTSSVLDTMGIKPKQKKQKMIVENVAPQTAAIDYSLIKTIVEECVKKNMVAMKKSVLNENKGQQTSDLAVMRIAESFKFVTKNGDIFEATLRKVGNVNEKKN